MTRDKDNDGSAICGGVVKQSEFMKDPMRYMMAYIMPDDKFEEYVELKNKDWDGKEAKQLFDKYARSAI